MAAEEHADAALLLQEAAEGEREDSSHQMSPLEVDKLLFLSNADSIYVLMQNCLQKVQLVNL